MSDFPSKNNFINFFKSEGILSCWQSEFLLRGSLGKGMLNLYKNKRFYSFINKEQSIYFAKKGLALYRNQKKFNFYIREFSDYVNKAKKEIIPKYRQTPSNVDVKTFKFLNNFLGKLWYYYGLMEFPYQDLAYDLAKNSRNHYLLKNLELAGRFKLDKARKIMNAYFFRQGVFENFFNYFNRYDVNGHFLYSEEMLDLIKGREIDRTKVKNRETCYAVININRVKREYSYPEAVKLFDKFSYFTKASFIQGLGVSQGIVRGRAVIMPLLHDQQSINKIYSRMNKGDILIAETTSPDVLPLCKKASAIVAEQGGMVSHAAIVARELKIPCIISARNATDIFSDNDLVEVDADRGIIRKIDKGRRH